MLVPSKAIVVSSHLSEDIKYAAELPEVTLGKLLAFLSRYLKNYFKKDWKVLYLLQVMILAIWRHYSTKAV